MEDGELLMDGVVVVVDYDVEWMMLLVLMDGLFVVGMWCVFGFCGWFDLLDLIVY